MATERMKLLERYDSELYTRVNEEAAIPSSKAFKKALAQARKARKIGDRRCHLVLDALIIASVK